MNGENSGKIKRIHLLDKKVAELIAAGEVVERPASAVKELLENAIDAGASMITLEIKNGGISFIRVTDNGSGILREDVPSAFLRHATSKILVEDDLTAIDTLGFRGEALASIAAVSKTELITRTEGELAGTHVVLEGGEIVETGDAGCPQGTTIIVRELFYNTPARMKFLKKDTTEGNAVAAVAQRIALSHPEVSLRFIKDGREELHTPGDNKQISAIHSVLGREFTQSLLEADYTLGHIRAHGYVTKPLAARSNRNMQFFFLNGRLVKSKTMMAALEEAYKNRIMVGKYPGCVLHITVNPAAVDVNVHPAKLEVRFSNEREVFKAVYYAAKNTLVKNDERPILDIKNEKEEPAAYFERGKKTFEIAFKEQGKTAFHTQLPESESSQQEQLRFILQNTPLAAENEAAHEVHSSVVSAYEPVSGGSIKVKKNLPTVGWKTENSVSQDNNLDKDISKIQYQNEKPYAAGLSVMPQAQENSSVTVIGQCFGTYILAQKGESLWIIDKHAAHERILYERVKSERKASSQVLLEPVAVTLPAEEYAAAIENIELLEEAGIVAEDFGGTALLVREAPLDLTGQEIPALVSEVSGLLVAHKRDITPARLDWIFHSVACRAAIKAHDRTTFSEMSSLAQTVLNTNDILYCPHGRPVAFELPRGELEKKFGR